MPWLHTPPGLFEFVLEEKKGGSEYASNCTPCAITGTMGLLIKLMTLKKGVQITQLDEMEFKISVWFENRFLYFLIFKDKQAGINSSWVGVKYYSLSAGMDKIKQDVIENHKIFDTLGTCNETFHLMQ